MYVISFLYFCKVLVYKYLNMKKIQILSAILLFTAINFLQLHSENKDKKTQLYIAQIVIGQGIDTACFHESKVVAAMNLITMLTDNYELISDSLIRIAAENLPEKYNAFDMAKQLKVDKILLVKVEQIKNMLRTEISQIALEKPESVATADGFAFMHYFDKKTNQAVYDPSLVESMQRAFAALEGDSLMFMKENLYVLKPDTNKLKNINNPYAVKPAPLLVIGGIEFENETPIFRQEIFDNDLIRSYEIAETIFEIAAKSNDWVTFDIASRDELYSFFNIYGIENNLALSLAELSVLQRFGINHYISGKLKVIDSELQITLTLNRINKNDIEKIAVISEKLLKDDKKEMLAITKSLTKKLLKM